MTVPSDEPVFAVIRAATSQEPDTIADVVIQLNEVQRALDHLPELFGENPIADFNVLYTEITERILDLQTAAAFHDAVFMNTLDVQFARRYLDALGRWARNDPTTPASWQVLFVRYNDKDLRSLPCAVAGVNAHINYDLAFALVSAWERLGHAVDGAPQHHDYLMINEVFRDAIPGLRRGFLTEWQRRVDRMNGSLDDWYENLLVQLTRNLAWTRAQRLWTLRSDPAEFEAERSAIDDQTAAIGGVLLSPLCSQIQ